MFNFVPFLFQGTLKEDATQKKKFSSSKASKPYLPYQIIIIADHMVFSFR
jgi:hypothetical protein